MFSLHNTWASWDAEREEVDFKIKNIGASSRESSLAKNNFEIKIKIDENEEKKIDVCRVLKT